METRKERFIENFAKAMGIISVACEWSGISRATFYRWHDSDPDFRREVEDIKEVQGDFVESKLLENIKGNDTRAIIFYCQSKLSSRGYGVKDPKDGKSRNGGDEYMLPEKEAESRQEGKGIGKDVRKRIETKKRYLIKLLKQEGKYTTELSMQAGLVAQLLVKTDMLADEIFSEGHTSVVVEYSREGNRREMVSTKERLYMEYVARSQRALRALGMNTDSKDRKTDGKDSLSDFLDNFKDED